jgi:hypothetical protein
MKDLKWDKCERLSSSGKFPPDNVIKPFRLVKPGMTASASLSGARIDITITGELKPDCLYSGIVKRIYGAGKPPADLNLGDEVSLPLEFICHLNQDT